MSNPFEDLRQAVVVRPISSSIVVIRPANSPGPQGPSGPELKIQYSANLLSWHDVPAENDMYVRFSTNNGRSWGEPLLISNLTGGVIGPESSVDGNIAVFDGATGKIIKDYGFTPEQLTAEFVIGPESSIDGGIAVFDGTTGKLVKDSGLIPEQLTNVWDVIIEDQKPEGTPGGSTTSGSWLTRDLNTLAYNYNSLASLSNNIFTLPSGTYCIDWSAPACEVDRHKTRLYNHTTSEVIAYGTSEYTTSGYRVSNRSHGIAIVTISTTTSFTIQHMCSVSRVDIGFGEQVGIGVEIYTRVCIKKIS